jgi:pimeloyl-ACP methyl ester carboxylesterase
MVDDGDARLGAATVHWRRTGTGPVIVLLHGFPLSGRTWEPVVARLQDRFTSVMPDLIGLDESSSTAEEDYGSPGQGRAIRGMLDALGIERYALVGNDTGGWVARELALIDRERVTHLVLTNTEIPGHRPPWIPTYQALAPLPGFSFVLRQLIRRPAFLRSPLGFGGCFHDLKRIDATFRAQYIEPLLQSGERMDGVRRFLRRMKFARLDEFSTLHAGLTMPTLFLWGADDPTFPEPPARVMATQFPKFAGFHSIPRGKLFYYLEQPDEVAAHIRDFVLDQARST